MFDLHLTPEQVALKRLARDFVNKEIKPFAVQWDREPDISQRPPVGVLIKASELGFRTLEVPEQLGGGGADTLTACIVLEELAVGETGIAITLSQTSIFARLLFQMMSEEQRQRFLPEFLRDHSYQLALARTEPDGDKGWDYFQPRPPGTGWVTQTKAHRTPDGDWLLNGVKVYISNGVIARLYAVEALVDDGSGDLVTLLVPAGAAGFSALEHDKVGRRVHSNGQLTFTDCLVPERDVLNRTVGGSAVWGRGSPRAAAMALGVGRAAYEAAVEYAKDRVQGMKPIIQHQAVGLKLAEIAINLEAARCLVWTAAWAADHPDAYQDGSLPDVPSEAIAKAFTQEAVHRATVDAMQVFGGMGMMLDMPVQKYVRDALIPLHSGGTTDVTSLQIMEYLVGYKRSGVRAAATKKLGSGDWEIE